MWENFEDTLVVSRRAAPRRDRRESHQEERDRQSQRQPRYHVVLWDDDEHTYDYVIRMMRKLFGHSTERGLLIAQQVDSDGRAICLTTTLEHAELKRDQIHAFGRDGLIQSCLGSMSCTIEPEKD